MVFVCFVFCAVFILVASGGQLIFSREPAQQKDASANATFVTKRSLVDTAQKGMLRFGNIVARMDGILPKSKKEASLVQRRLIRAGYREESAVRIFYGAKFLTIVLFVVVAFVTGAVRLNPLLFVIGAVGLGFMAPDFWLGRKIAARQKKIRLGLPDVLDLLIVCVEAGLSLDQATSRTAEELIKSQPVISDELGMVVLEQRAGRHRADAWRGFAERTDVPSVRSVVSLMIQSEQLGTSIGKTLRVHSETLRTQRIQQVEEQAAKASIKMLFPLVLLIFPSIFLVTLGPAVIQMLETLSKNNLH